MIPLFNIMAQSFTKKALYVALFSLLTTNYLSSKITSKKLENMERKEGLIYTMEFCNSVIENSDFIDYLVFYGGIRETKNYIKKNHHLLMPPQHKEYDQELLQDDFNKFTKII